MNEDYKKIYYIGQQIHFRYAGNEFVDEIKVVRRGMASDLLTMGNGLKIRSTDVISVIGGIKVEHSPTRELKVHSMTEKVVDESNHDIPHHEFTMLHNTLHGMNVDNWHRIKIDEALATGNKELFDELTGGSYV